MLGGERIRGRMRRTSHTSMREDYGEIKLSDSTVTLTLRTVCGSLMDYSSFLS